MSEPCPAEWSNDCGCPESHNYCWPEPATDCCPELVVTPETPAATVAIIEQAKRVAVQVLHAFSGRQFGLCRRVVRPCLDNCHQNGQVATAWVDGQLRPTLEGGFWFNRDVCGKCRTTGCGCSELCEVTLPGLVQSITQVKVNGEVLPSWMYRVDNHRKLVRVADYVPAYGPTSFAVVTVPPLADSHICDVTPAPDAFSDAVPGAPGCYDYTNTNPSFYWANQHQAEFLYNSDKNGTAAFFNGQYPAGSSYDFGPVGFVLNAGESVTSAENADGSFMKITALSGSATRVATPYSWDIIPGTRLRMERFSRGFEGCWPKCQDLRKPDTEPDTFSVGYLRGKPVPEGGRWASGLLACELVKACLPDSGECVLPDNVKTIAREGVTMELAPFIIGGADGKIEFGRTGVPEVDMWLIAVNPNKVRSRSRAYSPDRPNPRRQTFPCP